MIRAIAVVVLVFGAASSAAGQEIAGSFDQLRVLVKTGDRLRITDSAGREVTGTLAELRTSSLALVVEGARRDLGQDEISTIRQRRSDSLANGAKWGFAVGAGIGLLGGLALASGDGSSAAIIPVVSLLYGGIGAGIGVGVDAMMSAEQVIYAKRSALLITVGF